MYIVNHRKIFYALSGVIIAASFILLIVWGLPLSIDFKGGTLLEIKYEGDRPSASDIREKIAPLSLRESIRPTGDAGYIIRARHIEESERAGLMTELSFAGEKKVEQVRFDSVGPLLGREAALKSFISNGLVILCIVLFIAFAFRKDSEPVSSWKYGLIAVAALAHVVIVPTGAAVLLGHFAGFEADTLFVTALLVILGFSVHDTIVVFDRVRENLRLNKEYNERKEFSDIVGKSISQTFTRSVNTSLSTLLALVVLYLLGAEATRDFALILLIGIVAGTYSSICLASPLLVTVEKRGRKRERKRE